MPETLHFEPELYNRLVPFLPFLHETQRLGRADYGNHKHALAEFAGAMVALAFGTLTIKDEPIREHNRKLREHNHWIDRVSFGSRRVQLDFAEKGTVAFGHAVGCSCVYPVTADGFDRLAESEHLISDLFPDEILRDTACRGSESHIYLGPVIDVRRLTGRQQDLRTSFGKMFYHIAFFCPRLVWYRDVEFLNTKHGERLPRFCGHAFPGSAGYHLLRNAGFDECGSTRQGRIRMKLDLEDWKNSDQEWRNRVRRVIDPVQFYQRHRRI